MFAHRAIVTGGGTGLGLAVASLLAREGGEVLITGRSPDSLQKAAAGQPGLVPFASDITSEADIDRIVGKARQLWGSLTLLVNNAGIFRPASLENTDPAAARESWETNVLGPTLMTRAALPLLRQGGGCVVNVSSTTAARPTPGTGQYAAGKAALEQLTRVWALELAPDGIRVNCISPGPTETGILERSGLSPDVVARLKAEDCRRIPLARRGTADEVAWWAVRLADPAASWMTGVVLPVDGGLALG